MDDSWKYILEYFRIDPPSPETVKLTLSVLFFLLIVLVVVELYMRRRRKQKQRDREWQYFYRLAEAGDLSVDEARALEHLAKTYFPDEPQRITSSIKTFDELSARTLKNFQPWYEDLDEEETAELFAAIRDKLFLHSFHATGRIKSTREMPPGQRIRVTVKTERYRRFLHTFVEKNTRESITLFCEDFARYAEQFQPGATVSGYYWRTGDAGYQFPLKILNIIDDLRIEFEHTDEFSRKQRRLYFRVKTRLIGRFYKLSPEEERNFYAEQTLEKKSGQKPTRCIVSSLSGGGLSLFTEVRLERDDLLLLEVALAPDETVSGIVGRVVRIKDLQKRFKVFVEFLQVDEEKRETIIHHVSLIQRRQSK